MSIRGWKVRKFSKTNTRVLSCKKNTDIHSIGKKIYGCQESTFCFYLSAGHFSFTDTEDMAYKDFKDFFDNVEQILGY